MSRVVPDIPFSDAYGDYNRVSTDGKYWFEWTPFPVTPAIRAWERADRHLRNARDRLVEARKIEGFAIPGLEHDCEHFKGQLKVLVDDVDEATREAGKVVQVLEVAHTDYAKARDATGMSTMIDPGARGSGAMQRARDRFNRELRAADPDGRVHSDLGDLQTLQQYINEEINKTVNREVDPLLDFTYGVGTQAAEKTHETVNRPAPSPDLPDAPSGTVAQPVRN